MGLLGSLGDWLGSKTVQNPAFYEQRRMDAVSMNARGNMAQHLMKALAQSEGFGTDQKTGIADILRRKGDLGIDAKRRMAKDRKRNMALMGDGGPEGFGGRGAVWQSENAAQRTAMAGDKMERQRGDLAGIFGPLVLGKSLGVSNLYSGTLEAKKGDRAKADKFLDGINKGIGSLGL